MEKWFDKNDLKAGYLLEIKIEGRISYAMVLPNQGGSLGISGEEDWFPVRDIGKEMRRGNTIINKVYGLTSNRFSHKLEPTEREILWDRKNMVDWSKVKVDTPVLVTGDSGTFPRHFAKYIDGRIYVWNNGKTSHTEENKTWFDNVKLA